MEARTDGSPLLRPTPGARALPKAAVASDRIPSIARVCPLPLELQGEPLALATCELCVIDCPPQIQKIRLYPFPPLFIHPPSAFSNVRTFGCPSSVPKNVILWLDFCFPPPGCGLQEVGSQPTVCGLELCRRCSVPVSGAGQGTAGCWDPHACKAEGGGGQVLPEQVRLQRNCHL